MRSTGSERGAALIEIMVAVVILVASMLGLANSTINSRRAGDNSRHSAEATTLGFDKFEHLRTMLSSAADLTPGSHSDGGTLAPDGSSGGIFTRSWTVALAVPSTGLARIEMHVSWPTQSGTGSVSLVGYLLNG